MEAQLAGSLLFLPLFPILAAGMAGNRQGFSHREADAKSLLDEAIRRGMGGASTRAWALRVGRGRLTCLDRRK
jgi:hypothetical protein